MVRLFRKTLAICLIGLGLGILLVLLLPSFKVLAAMVMDNAPPVLNPERVRVYCFPFVMLDAALNVLVVGVTIALPIFTVMFAALSVDVTLPDVSVPCITIFTCEEEDIFPLLEPLPIFQIGFVVSNALA